MGDYDDDLPDLRYHWGSAYLISHPKLGLWIAQRRDTRETLRSDSAAELLELIRADYAAHPVSRRIAGADDRPETPTCRFLPEG